MKDAGKTLVYTWEPSAAGAESEQLVVLGVLFKLAKQENGPFKVSIEWL